MSRFVSDDRGLSDMQTVMVAVVLMLALAALVGFKVIPVIPWAQDAVAKISLAKVVDAQHVARTFDGSFVSEQRLVELGLIKASDAEKFETAALENPWDGSEQEEATKGHHFYAAMTSGSGKFFLSHDTQDPTESARPTPLTGTMVMKWDTSIEGCSTITIPMSGVAGGSSIDWGDGNVEQASDKPSHAYAVSGPVTTTFTGSFNRFSFYDTFVSMSDMGSAPCVTSVDSWSGTRTTDLYAAFFMAANLKSIPHIPRSVTNLDMALSGVAVRADVSAWNTSKVTSMNGTFGYSDFNGDISSWDTSNVQSMQSMFAGSTFNGTIKNWDVSKVRDMSSMFAMSSFNRPLDGWNTSNVERMDGMFSYAKDFDQDLNSWDTSKVTTMEKMFGWTDNFNSGVDRWDTSRVTTMKQMFAGAKLFNQPIGSWDTTSLTNTDSMFSSTLKFDRSLAGWNTSSIKTMRQMFSGASAFNGDVSSWVTRNVEDMSAMFFGAVRFNQPLNWDTSKVTTMGSMFSGAHVFNQNIGGWDTSSVTIMHSMFLSALAFEQDLSNWNVAKVSGKSSIFTSSPMLNKPLLHPKWP